MKLEEFIAQSELSVSAFAKLVGASDSAVQFWCVGKRIPRMAHMQKIAEVTDGKVTADDFFGIERDVEAAE